VLCTLVGTVVATDPDCAVHVGVIRRKTEYTPVMELAKRTDFRFLAVLILS